MSEFTILIPSEQVAAHLRGELLRGRWSGTMPGVPALGAELGVDPKTAGLALSLLEEEGLLVGQGPGRPRRIELPKGLAAPALRVGILPYEDLNRRLDYMVDLRHMLVEAGHVASFASKTMLELGMNVKRIHRLVAASEADAWVVVSAPREVLEWFSTQPVPAFALFGRRRRVRIAAIGPDHVPTMRTAVQRLIALGHQRIVMLERWGARGTGPGPGERAALEEMAKHGLRTGPYNLPDWEATPGGLRRVLDELFRVTPPTALIIDEAFLFHAAKEHLAQMGILAPKHVSLICIDGDPTFDWCEPSVAHIQWDSRPWVRRIVRWANNVSRGKEDLRQTLTKAEFVDGGTVGRAVIGDWLVGCASLLRALSG
jgi:DNA-binding LacI/PurR family transcriptional regulator